MIKWCIGIWNNEDTFYFSYDDATGKYGFSTELKDALLFPKRNRKLDETACWLPVFVIDDLIDD